MKRNIAVVGLVLALLVIGLLGFPFRPVGQTTDSVEKLVLTVVSSLTPKVAWGTTTPDYVCDGTADEVQIQAALGALPATGGTVQLSPGLFVVNKQLGQTYAIKVPSLYLAPSSDNLVFGPYGRYRDTNPICLRGMGAGTIIKLADDQNCDVIQIGEDADGGLANESARVENLYILGNAAHQSAGNYRGIYIYTDMNCGFITDVKVVGCQGNGIESENNRYWRLANIGSDGNGRDGVRINGGYQNSIVNSFFFSNGYNGVNLTSYNGTPSHRNVINEVHCISNGVVAALHGIQINGNDNVVCASQCYDELAGAAKTQYYGIAVEASASRTVITSNMLVGNKIGPIYNAGTGTIITGNGGYINKGSGTATILSGNASVIVTHGMVTTPTSISFAGTQTEVKDCIASSVNATYFTITASANVTGDRGVYWMAEIQ